MVTFLRKHKVQLLHLAATVVLALLAYHFLTVEVRPIADFADVDRHDTEAMANFYLGLAFAIASLAALTGVFVKQP